MYSAVEAARLVLGPDSRDSAGPQITNVRIMMTSASGPLRGGGVSTNDGDLEGLGGSGGGP